MASSREFSQIRHRFWSGETGRKLRAICLSEGADSWAVALYLCTCQSSHMSGLYYLPLPTLCHEIGLSRERADDALDRLSELSFAYYDEEREEVWVVSMAREQISERLEPTDKRHSNVMEHLRSMIRSPLAAGFINAYRETFSIPDTIVAESTWKPHRRGIEGASRTSGSPIEGASKGHREPAEAPSKGHRRGIAQEQEKETDQEHGEEDSPAGAGAPSDQPLALVADEPTAPKAAAKKRTPRQKPPATEGDALAPPAKEPPPFSVDRAVDLVAAAAPTRFARPAEIPKESRINIALRVRAHPTEDQWTWLGAYLEAGGEAWLDSPSVGFLASNRVIDALATAAKWHAAGRPNPSAKTNTSKRPSGALDPSMTGNTPDSWGF